MHRVNLRGLPGALALGLLVSLLAHTVSYGTGHAEGGAFHLLLVGLAAVAILGFAVRAITLACSGVGNCLQGSILATRLSSLVPSRSLLAVASLGWFALGESLEPAHADASTAIILAAVVAVALLIRSITVGALRALARIAVAIAAAAFAPHILWWTPHTGTRPLPQRFRLARRRFARPPPGSMLAA